MTAWTREVRVARQDDAAAEMRRAGRHDALTSNHYGARDDAFAGDRAPASAPASNSAPARNSATARNSAEAHSFSVASMNLHCGVSSTGEPFDVEGVIRGLDATIIALQETWLADSQPRSGLAEAAGKDGRHRPFSSSPGDATDPVTTAARSLGAELLRVPLCTFPDLARIGIPPGSGPGRFGMAVLTKLPVIDYDVVRLGPAPGDSIPRYAQIVWLALDDQVMLRFVNTHLTYRPASPVQLWRLRRRLRGYSGPTMIVGDLNMPGPIASLTARYAAAVTGRTWPAERPLLQLDHVLASTHIEAVAGTVLPHCGSDHLPVRAQLKVRATQPMAHRSARTAASRASG